MDAAANIIDKTAKAGMGQVPVELSHPIHPATVHFPIAFMTAQFTLDALQHFTPGIFPHVSSAVAATSTGSIFSRLIPPASIVSSASMYLGGAGVAFSLISIATGLSELYGMVKGQTQEKGSLIKTIKDAYTAPESDVAATKLKTTLTHASLNDITVGIAAYNVYKRATSSTLALPKTNAYLAAAILPLFMYSAYLGGALVYEMGVGVFRQGKAVEYKQMQDKSQ